MVTPKQLSFDTHTTKQDMGNYLTTSQKDRLTPYLIKRDGANCFYCTKPFQVGLSKQFKRTIDHLDNNPKNNDKENLVLSHFECNQLKKTYPEFQIMAESKSLDNHNSFDILSESETTPPKPASKEIDLNVMAKKLAWEYIQERLVRQGKPALNYNDTAHSISFMMWELSGHGSSETIKRYLNDFTSSAAPFKAIDENGVTVIVKKT